MVACSNGKEELTEEKRELRCQGLFDEFLQNIDLNEAVLSAQELATPGMQHDHLAVTRSSRCKAWLCCFVTMRFQITADLCVCLFHCYCVMAAMNADAAITQVHPVTTVWCSLVHPTMLIVVVSCFTEFVPRMVQIGISKLFEVTREKDQTSLVTVLVGLQTKGALSAEQLLAGIRKSTDQLEDLRSVALCSIVVKVVLGVVESSCQLLSLFSACHK